MDSEPFIDRMSLPVAQDDSRLIAKMLPYLAIGILLVSSIDDGWAGGIAKVFWLFLFLGIGIIDIGSAFGLYLFAVAVYNPKHVWQPGAVLERIDNFALIALMIVAFIEWVNWKQILDQRRLLAFTGIFFIIPLFQAFASGSWNYFIFAQFIRMFGLPLIGFFILAGTSVRIREMKSFISIMIVLGIYMSVVAIMEQIGVVSIIIPPWIGDWKLNGTLGSGRSGGLLLQSEFTGLALGLIYCLLFWPKKIAKGPGGLVQYAIGALLFVGTYLTYTRAAWMAIGMCAVVFFLLESFALGGKIVKSILMGLLGVSLVLFVFIQPAKVAGERVSDVGTINYRLNLWSAGLKMAAERPILGHGISQFEKKAADYQGSLGNIPEIKIAERGTGAHNIFINLLVEQGLVGLVLFICIIWGVFSSARKAVISWGGFKGTEWLFLFTMVYFINAQFLNIHEPVTNLIYFGTMGMVAGLRENRSESVGR